MSTAPRPSALARFPALTAGPPAPPPHLPAPRGGRLSYRDNKVQSHLVDVYRTLFLALGSASVGVYADFTGFTATYLPLLNGGGFVSMLLSMGLLVWLLSEPAVPSNMRKREGIFYSFALLQGLSLGTLVSLVYYIDPSYGSAVMAAPPSAVSPSASGLTAPARSAPLVAVALQNPVLGAVGHRHHLCVLHRCGPPVARPHVPDAGRYVR